MSPTISLILPVYNAEAYLPTALDSILAQTYFQTVTPASLLGKVGSFVTAIATCAIPLGQGIYGLLLDRLEKRRGEGLTTPKQIRCLERYGFRHVGQWPMEEAAHMIDRIAAMGWRGVPRGVDPATYQPEV